MTNIGGKQSTFFSFLSILIKIQFHSVIAPGFNYIGMKWRNVYNEKNDIRWKKPTIIYPWLLLLGHMSSDQKSDSHMKFYFSSETNN